MTKKEITIDFELYQEELTNQKNLGFREGFIKGQELKSLNNLGSTISDFLHGIPAQNALIQHFFGTDDLMILINLRGKFLTYFEFYKLYNQKDNL
jgi:hypothetical protein